jgi:peroxin-19
MAGKPAEDEDLDALLESTLEEMEAQEKQKPTPLPTPVQSPASAKPSAGPSAATSSADQADAEMMAAAMKKLMDQMEKSGDTKSVEELAKKFEESTVGARPAGIAPPPAPFNTDFTRNIEETLKKLDEDTQKLKSTDKLDDEVLMRKLMEQFEANPELGGVMEQMMNQIMSKDVLYAPMKELQDKYPAWLATKGTALPPADLDRYQRQFAYVQRICVLYEKDSQDQAHILQLLQEMQELGQPPPELVKELAGGEYNQDSPDPLGLGLPPGADKNCSVM